MSDKDVFEGMKAFAEWYKSVMDHSKEATTWKIPLECLPKNKPKKVWLTIEEARFVRKWLGYLSAEGNAFPLKEKNREDLWDFGWSLTERIKQAEGKECKQRNK